MHACSHPYAYSTCIIVCAICHCSSAWDAYAEGCNNAGTCASFSVNALYDENNIMAAGVNAFVVFVLGIGALMTLRIFIIVAVVVGDHSSDCMLIRKILDADYTYASRGRCCASWLVLAYVYTEVGCKEWRGCRPHQHQQRQLQHPS